MLWIGLEAGLWPIYVDSGFAGGDVVCTHCGMSRQTTYGSKKTVLLSRSQTLAGSFCWVEGWLWGTVGYFDSNGRREKSDG